MSSGAGSLATTDMGLTDCWELGAIYADHAQFADFSSPAEVEHRQPYHADLLIRSRGTTSDKTGGVLAGTDLDSVVTLAEFIIGVQRWRTINTLSGSMTANVCRLAFSYV